MGVVIKNLKSRTHTESGAHIKDARARACVHTCVSVYVCVCFKQNERGETRANGTNKRKEGKREREREGL